MTAPRFFPIAWAPALMLLLGGSLQAVPQVEIRERERVQLEFRALNANSGTGEPQRIDVDPETGGEARFELGWPEPGSTVSVRIRARELTAANASSHLVELSAEIVREGSETRRAERRIEFKDETTALFELLREPVGSLTLAVLASTKQETVVRRAPVAGSPIRFKLEIQRIEENRSVTLETNLLQSFVGQPVSYSFDLGSESANLTIHPVSLSGDVAEIDVEVSGRLPGAEGPSLLGRREHWITSRGARSSFSFEAGDPPAGYRFLITPEF